MGVKLEGGFLLVKEVCKFLVMGLKIPSSVDRIADSDQQDIKNFNDDAVLNIISNTFTSQDTSTLNAINFQPSFNPIDKIVELYNEKIILLERLLASEK